MSAYEFPTLAQSVLFNLLTCVFTLAYCLTRLWTLSLKQINIIIAGANGVKLSYFASLPSLLL